MTEKTINSQEARRKWRDMLDQIPLGKRFIVERHGKPVAVVISPKDYEALREAEAGE